MPIPMMPTRTCFRIAFSQFAYSSHEPYHKFATAGISDLGRIVIAFFAHALRQMPQP
jgi:hypothetical protein